MDVGFLARFTDGGWRNFAAPQSFCNIFHPAHRDAGKVHLDESFFAAFAAEMLLDVGRFKKDALEMGSMECHPPER